MNTRLSGGEGREGLGEGFGFQVWQSLPSSVHIYVEKTLPENTALSAEHCVHSEFPSLDEKKPSSTTLPLWCSCLESLSVKGDGRQAAAPPWGRGGIGRSIRHTCLE